MASYRPFLPQSSFNAPPSQNPIAPRGPQPQLRGNQYNQNWGYGGGDGSVPSAPSTSFPQNYNQMPQNSNYHHGGYGSTSQHYVPPRGQQPPPPPPPSHQQYPYPAAPPPPPETSYLPPPPPPPPPPAQSSGSMQPPRPSVYYPSNQYSQYNQQQPPPPPPSSPPPSSSIPPPPPPPSSPPPSSAPPHGQIDEERRLQERNKGSLKEVSTSGRREHLNHGAHSKHQKPASHSMLPKKPNAPPGRVETEEERRLRKKREFEKQRHEERHGQQLKDSQKSRLQKTQMLSSGKGHGSITGSRIGEKRPTSLLSGERIENRLKKPTTFLCKLRFRNELPDPSAQPKLMAFKKDKDQYSKYTITSLEKMYKPKLFVEPDLGIPLDLLDLSVYNPSSVIPPLAPEDEELLRDDETVTPIKKDGIRRKERPTDKGVAWLVKTQYISPLSMESTKQSLTEKQAKELRDMKGGRNILENLNNRERQIKEIEASFEAAKSHPVHATNKNLYPVEVLPLLPDLDRYDDQFVVAAFDNSPTADSEIYNKLDKSDRDAHESRAIMKTCVGSDPANPEKFLAYLAPAPGELSRDIYDESEEVSYSWVREYHLDVRGDDVDDPTTYLVSFDESEARYLPLPKKLVLRKKRAKEGRSGDEHGQFPVPSKLTVRRRSSVAIIEQKDSGVYTNLKGSALKSKRRNLDMDDAVEHQDRVAEHQDNYQSSGAEDYMSD